MDDLLYAILVLRPYEKSRRRIHVPKMFEFGLNISQLQLGFTKIVYKLINLIWMNKPEWRLIGILGRRNLFETAVYFWLLEDWYIILESQSPFAVDKFVSTFVTISEFFDNVGKFLLHFRLK